MKNNECFFENGLDFKCREGCVDCCANESGFVFLSQRDLENISKATGLTQSQAIEVYTRKFISDGGEERIVLKEYSDKRCVFLCDKGCSIYQYRPIQCSTYPFWPRVLASKKAWDREKDMCPGIGDKSAHASKSEILSQLTLFVDNV